MSEEIGLESALVDMCSKLLFYGKDRAKGLERFDKLVKEGFDGTNLIELFACYKHNLSEISTAIDFGVAKIDANSEGKRISALFTEARRRLNLEEQ
jgi:hypothetical protein